MKQLLIIALVLFLLYAAKKRGYLPTSLPVLNMPQSGVTGVQVNNNNGGTTTVAVPQSGIPPVVNFDTMDLNDIVPTAGDLAGGTIQLP